MNTAPARPRLAEGLSAQVHRGCNMRRLKCDKRYLIDATKPWHVSWWAAELGVSEDSLLEAVDVVGNQARAVEYRLRLGKPSERRRGRRSADVACTIQG